MGSCPYIPVIRRVLKHYGVVKMFRETPSKFRNKQTHKQEFFSLTVWAYIMNYFKTDKPDNKIKKEREIDASYNGIFSTEQTIICGAPKGSFLEPLVFLVYIIVLVDISSVLFTKTFLFIL